MEYIFLNLHLCGSEGLNGIIINWKSNWPRSCCVGIKFIVVCPRFTSGIKALFIGLTSDQHIHHPNPVANQRLLNVLNR